jgi:hypothetical protein
LEKPQRQLQVKLFSQFLNLKEFLTLILLRILGTKIFHHLFRKQAMWLAFFF